MDTPLVTKIKQIILSTNPQDWAAQINQIHYEIYVDEFKIVYYNYDGDPSFYISVDGRCLKLSHSAEQNLINFCETLFYGQETYLEESLQKELADKIMNYKIGATS